MSVYKYVKQKLLQNCNEYCFAHKKHGKWIKYSKHYFLETSEKIALELIKLGIKKGDRVIIASENRPEWNFVDFACLMIGAISVPVYITIDDESITKILKEISPKVIFISNKYLYRKIKPKIDKLSINLKLFTFDKVNAIETNIFEISNNNLNNKSLKKITENIEENDICTIIYSYGLTGKLSGSMHSHKSHLIIFDEGLRRLNLKDGYKSIHYIPLSTSFGRVVNYTSIISGLTIYYTNGVSNIEKEFRLVKPDFFATAPLLLDKIKNKINNLENISNETNKAFGNRLRTILVGGAIVHKEIYKFYTKAGIKLLNGYGLTETLGVVSLDSFHEKTKAEYSGKAINGMNIRISSDGEILVKGNNLIQAYFNNPKLTKKVLDENNWLHTGDIGEIDDEGYLKLIGTIKPIYKLINGEYVNPFEIENELLKNDYIKEVLVYGIAKQFNIALIIPNIDKIKDLNLIDDFSNKKNIVENKNIIDFFYNIINKYNSTLFNANKRVEKLILIDDKWYIKRQKDITFEMINKRNEIIKKYGV